MFFDIFFSKNTSYALGYIVYNKYMIYTVTLNPSLDYHAFTDRFAAGELNRSNKELLLPGGKGINVATVMKEFGYECTLLGFTAGTTGQEIKRLVSEAGLVDEMTGLPSGMSRINVKIHAKEETELNGTGPFISSEDLESLMKRIDRINDGDVLVLSGSIPPSLPDTVYAMILDRIKGKDIITAVDATGDLLMNTLPLRPFVIKPNIEELGALFGAKIKTREGCVPYAKKIQEAGAGNVLVSLGKDGAVLLTEDGRFIFCNAPSGSAVNTIGSGDSMLAGFLHGMMEKNDHIYALRTAIAAGSACAFSEGLAKKELTEALMSSVEPYTFTVPS